MRTDLACPKCDSRRVWQIEKIGIAEQGTYHRPLRLACGRRRSTQAQGALQKFWHGSRKSYDAGFVDAWVCAKCGYTELWSSDFEALEHNPDQGIRLHDSTPQQGQYR